MIESYVRTFVDDFFKSATTVPDAPAFVFSEKTTTYSELLGMVQGIREWIDAEVPSDMIRIAVYSTQDVRTYAAILAILAAGKAYVPLNPLNPPQRNENCLTQADISILFFSGGNTGTSRLLLTKQTQITAVDTELIPTSPSLRLPNRVCEDDMAYLLFTSGSTGDPKGVPLHHGNLARFMTALVKETGFQFNQSDRFLQMFDLTFDLSIMSFATPLAVGAACHVVSGSGVGFLEVAKTLKNGEITVALMVPSVLSFLESYLDEITLPEIRYSLFCGEALPVLLAAKWRSCIPSSRLFNVYGPTEATIFCSLYELQSPIQSDGQYQGVVCIGSPLPGTEFSIIDDNGITVSPGEKGELVIHGHQVTNQYWKNEEKSLLSFSKDLRNISKYRTGDIAFCSNGNYFYCGRADFQLKVDGYRVESGEIEHHARELDGVRNVALIGQTSSAGRVELHLFLEAKSTLEETLLLACKTQMAEKLPPYMRPSRVHVVDYFPLNQNGKVDRKALISGLARG